MQDKFIIVGENIHCTRVRLTAGKFVTELSDGRKALAFKADGQLRQLPVPEDVVRGEEWANGRVRHVAVAVRQGLHGAGGDQAAGIAYLQAMAKEQQAHGAHFLDLNVDELGTDLDEKIRAVAWTAGVLQEACALPLSIDSSNPDILKAGLQACDPARGRPLVNSVSLERASLIEVAAAAGAKVVASAAGAGSMPDSVEERLANLAQLMALLQEAGIALEDRHLDPLVFPVSVDVTHGLKVIDTIRACRKTYGPDVHFAPGLSNVSFGLPRRPLINLVFAHLCHAHGCDGGIVDPAQINDRTLAAMDTSSTAYKLASALLCGTDEYGMGFIAAARDGTI